MNINISIKDDSTTWEELVDLFHEAFQERLDQGLHFSCSYFTPEILKQQSADRIVLVAKDEDTGKLVGTASLEFIKNSKETWSYFSNMAIDPSCKRCGIGSKLEKKRVELAAAHGCDHVISDTADGAKSSVKWHYNNGFKLFSLKSWPETNYYSYSFRKQIQPDFFWEKDFFCRIHFLLSALRCRLRFKANGERTNLMKLISSIKGKA